ncbi:hypothetical protein HMPREF0322_02248 [Desulfitobacterium hafniense DP7]|uniref:Uncharacterized protein n=1 Tax=Desulfitobacterium hafniense DP7 TaxID=537010 RepID=G9XMR0_DESHA|nr:hypothetical protein HMPREF0322_02248 [Desulfitobacterium hafniense DP7]
MILLGILHYRQKSFLKCLVSPGMDNKERPYLTTKAGIRSFSLNDYTADYLPMISL